MWLQRKTESEEKMKQGPEKKRQKNRQKTSDDQWQKAMSRGIFQSDYMIFTKSGDETI